jgi:serine/threonine-protein kinase
MASKATCYSWFAKNAMPLERWQQIEDLFHAALEVEPAARQSFLDDACGGDGDLRREVESLLDQDGKNGRLVSQPLEMIAAVMLDADASEVRFSKGAIVGPYEIIEPLGAGGMGEVYRARDTRLDRTVAIKILMERFHARFESEARAISALNHPHICTLYDIGSLDGVGYLVMEFIDGEPLVSQKRPGPLPFKKALRLAIQILDALAVAHAHGILHRDLKPANILVAKTGVKLLDFGLAKFVPAGAHRVAGAIPAPLTESRQIVGTVQYMSPEQLEGKEVDARSDIFSFGLVLYEMLTGRRAFQASSQAGLMAAILKEQPPPLPSLQASIPPALDRAASKCLAKEPERRWQSAADLRDELEWIASGDSAAPQTVTRRSMPFRMAAAGALAIVAALGWWTAWRSTRPVDNPLMRLNVDLGPDAVVGLHITAAISPDGTRLAFPARRPDGRKQLATRLLDQREATLLFGTEGADDPFFSPDGQWIGFFAEGKMKKVSVRGGAAVVLCDAPYGVGAAWGGDDNIIATLSGRSHIGLSRVPAAGGTPQSVTRPDENGDSTHRWPQILPGGQAVLFMANKTISNYDNSSIEVLSLETGRVKVVQRDAYFGRYLPGGYLVYIHQGTLFGVRFDLGSLEVSGTPTPLLDDVAADSNTAGGQFDFSLNGRFVYLSGKSTTATWTQAWLDRAGGTKPLLALPSVYYEPRLSPDGKRLAFSSGTDIETYDWGRETRTRLTFATDTVNNWPVWTPDGEHIVFGSEGANKCYLQWIRADGAGEAQVLLESNSLLSPYSFSPDGKRVAFSERNSGTGSDLWMLPLDTSDPEHPRAGKREEFLRSRFLIQSPSFSPDGRWISYSSTESGRSEIFVQPFRGGGQAGSGKWLISTGGGQFPIWSRDGRELFYETLDNRIMVAAFTAKGVSFAAEKPRLWSDTQLLDINGHWNFDLAPDGKRFVVTMRADSTAQPRGSVHVTFLLNFFDELRRRIPAGS